MPESYTSRGIHLEQIICSYREFFDRNHFSAICLRAVILAEVSYLIFISQAWPAGNKTTLKHKTLKTALYKVLLSHILGEIHSIAKIHNQLLWVGAVV